MSEEYIFDVKENFISCLSELSLTQSELEERRICELSELAFEVAGYFSQLCREGIDFLEIFSLLSETILLPDGFIHDGAMDENLPELRRYLSTLCEIDKTIFSGLLIKRLEEYGIKIEERDFLSGKQTPETFVYVKNPYADEAYDVFSQDFSDPRVWYCKDFKEGLSMVSKGEVGYCLLPLEDSGSRIQSVQELIFKGDFKISAVTPVFGFDGNADMKYCLVSKDYFYPDFSDEDDKYLELRISKEAPLTHLLTVAEYFGYDIYRINSVNLRSQEGDNSCYSVMFRDMGTGFLPILIYILLFTDECTPLGIYKNLE